ILAPAVATKPAALAENVVARDEPRNGVGADRTGDRARAARGADRVRQLTVARAIPSAELEECLPHLELEVGAADVHSQRSFTAPPLGRPDAQRQRARLFVVTNELCKGRRHLQPCERL